MNICLLALSLFSTPIFSTPYLQPYAPYFSQFGQDKWINEHIFFNKKNGFFVEIGAHDGISYSNTCYFEKELGWQGICVEPYPDRFAELIKNRKAHCVQACISDFNGTAPFLKLTGYTEMLSGLLTEYDQRHLDRIDQEIVEMGGGKELIEVSVITFDDLLAQHQVQQIDLLSIDVEGCEEKILNSINFKKYNINVIIVENNYDNPRFQSMLKEYGYIHLITIRTDQIFLKSVYQGT